MADADISIRGIPFEDFAEIVEDARAEAVKTLVQEYPSADNCHALVILDPQRYANVSDLRKLFIDSALYHCGKDAIVTVHKRPTGGYVITVIGRLCTSVVVLT